MKIFSKILYNSYFYTKRLGLGLYFFGNPNTLYNNLFNKLHLKLIANKETDNEDILQFLRVSQVFEVLTNFALQVIKPRGYWRICGLELFFCEIDIRFY